MSWEVVLHDDDTTPAEVVAHALVRFAGNDLDGAIDLVGKVIRDGNAVQSRYDERQHAEAVVAKLAVLAVHATVEEAVDA